MSDAEDAGNGGHGEHGNAPVAAPEQLDIWGCQRHFEFHKLQWENYGRTHNVMYALPALFVTVVGGLWFFSFQALEKDKGVSLIVMIFAAICSLLFAGIIGRFEHVTAEYLKMFEKREGNLGPKIDGWNMNSGVTAIIIMAFACAFSCLGIFYIAQCKSPDKITPIAAQVSDQGVVEITVKTKP